jgi:hypothetical protein
MYRLVEALDSYAWISFRTSHYKIKQEKKQILRAKEYTHLTGAVSRDFQPLVFFVKQNPWVN